MIIPITVAAGSSSRLLPPQFAQFGADEVVLIEMQGALEVEGDSSGQFVGKLTVDPETVSCRRVCMFTGHSDALYFSPRRRNLLYSSGTTYWRGNL